MDEFSGFRDPFELSGEGCDGTGGTNPARFGRLESVESKKPPLAGGYFGFPWAPGGGGIEELNATFGGGMDEFSDFNDPSGWNGGGYDVFAGCRGSNPSRFGLLGCGGRKEACLPLGSDRFPQGSR